MTLVFNLTDLFGTANVTVGSLTDPPSRPTHRRAGLGRSDNREVTLVANGSITESSDATAPPTSSRFG